MPSPITAFQDRLSPVWRGVVKVTLAMALVALMYGLADVLLLAAARVGWVDPGTETPKYAAEYALAAVALSYQADPVAMRRSFVRRFAGTAAGIGVGALLWNLPLDTPITAIISVGAGWAAGVMIGGVDVADKAAFFAGITALQPADDFAFSLLSRLTGTALGFVAVLVVITWVWPTDRPEEPARRLIG